MDSEMSIAQEVSHEGYHLYKIPFKVNLANNESTQLKFLNINHIPITRVYETQLTAPFYNSGEQKHNVIQSIVIKTLEKALPMGTIRSYSKQDKTTLLLGESHIKHTPKHEKIKIKLGQNFDLIVKSTPLSNNDDRYYNDVTVSYEVTNRSDKAKTVELLIPFTKRDNQQNSISTPQKYGWKNGRMLSFKVPMKADSKKSFEVHFRAKK